MTKTDAYELERFVAAQKFSYQRALAEISAGLKKTHWMWYIFPQIAGLGFSATSQRYAIRSRDEAEAYLRHPVLGTRLVQCAGAALAVEGRSARDIFGTPDDLKLRSSATLFANVASVESVFRQLLDQYFDGRPDEATLHALARLAKRA